MNDRKYPLYFYWGAFGHANNHSKILEVNDLINSFDWLNVRKNQAYPVFTNASCNDKLPWPDNLADKKSGQLNAFFRWSLISDSEKHLKVSLFIVSPDDLQTNFKVPQKATADVTLRRLQKMNFKKGDSVRWSFGEKNGEIIIGENNLFTVETLDLSRSPQTLILEK